MERLIGRTHESWSLQWEAQGFVLRRNALDWHSGKRVLRNPIYYLQGIRREIESPTQPVYGDGRSKTWGSDYVCHPRRCVAGHPLVHSSQPTDSQASVCRCSVRINKVTTINIIDKNLSRSSDVTTLFQASSFLTFIISNRRMNEGWTKDERRMNLFSALKIGRKCGFWIHYLTSEVTIRCVI